MNILNIKLTEIFYSQEYPDYYTTIAQPIAMSHLRKRAQGNYYKDLAHYRDEWKLMFRNARTYNQEGSWVYVDAEEMEKVFDRVFDSETRGSGLPGIEPTYGGNGRSGGTSYQMDEDERPSRRNGGRNPKQVLSDDEEYLTPSDND